MASSHVEILAPAGSPDSFKAALNSGANAVYLGLKAFNARGNAINFSVEELAHYVPLAHRHQMKVYLTLNTVVKMNERGPLLEALAGAADCGIDGVILQDIGLGRTIARYFPKLRRHASTQLAIHNLDGVQFCVDEGFERVVLARELTLREIQAIRAAFPPDRIELEVFCHGAMCYTYSGMCYFSGAVGGRSGNRGECAYTCRKGYRIENETRFPMAPEPDSFRNYLFSMKDMNTLDVLPELMAAGVDSLKIEGRRKGPAYVSASVEAYRARMEQGNSAALERDLQLAFGRDYTRAFYQRGQYGDAPVDLTATGSKGIAIGTIDEDGSFRLEVAGIQRYDGLRLVAPNREESLISFRDYRVSSGDRIRPETGARIQLADSFPQGTIVYWVRSQDVERRYQPAKDRTREAEDGAGTVDVRIVFEGDTLTITYACRYGESSESLTLQPSTGDRKLPLRATLFRFGDSDFQPGEWFGPEEVEGFVQLSQLKKLRRRLLADLAARSEQGRAVSLTELIGEANRSNAEPVKDLPASYIVRLDNLELLESLSSWLLDNDLWLDWVPRATMSTPDWKKTLSLLEHHSERLRIALPMVMRHWDERVLSRRIAQAGSLFPTHVLSNPGHLPMIHRLTDHNPTKVADFSIYHLNTWAVKALSSMGFEGFTLSLEDDRPNMEALLAALDPARFEVIAYTDTPLFVAEACSLAALYGGCPGAKVCGHETLFISNEHGDRFQVRHDRCRSTVIGEKALSWCGDLSWFHQRGVHRFRADFTTRPYTPDQVKQIVEAMMVDRTVPQTHTENLDRILL